MVSEWTDLKLRTLLGAWKRRKEVERLETRRNAMITGVYANSNYDAQKAGEAAPRDEIVKTIDEGFNERIAQIYGTEIETSIERVEKHFAGSPFFRSVRASTMLTPRERAELLASL